MEVSAITRAVARTFRTRFMPGAEVIWARSPSVGACLHSLSRLSDLGVTALEEDDLPTVVVLDACRRLVVLVDVVAERGAMNSSRSKVLRELFRPASLDVVLVNAFRSRSEIGSLEAMIAWDTCAWFVDEPDHLIVFG